MSDTPPDWVLIKATEECGWAVIPDELHKNYHTIGSFRALCNRIAKDEYASWTYKLGDLLTKTKGSCWTGHVVGFYQTALTKEGYAIESINEPGSVQIYPVSALRRFER